MNLKKVSVGVFALCLMANVSVAADVKKSNCLLDKKISDINLLLEKNEYTAVDKLLLNVGNNVQYKVLSAISLTMQDKLDAAQDVLDSIKPSALDVADYYYAQGALYLKRIDTSDMRFRNKNDELIQLAINQLEYSLKINPKNAKVYNALGVAQLKKDELYKAEQNFKKAVELAPKYSTALDNLGTIYYITNDLNKAESYFKKAQVTNPSSSTVYYHLAQVSLKKEDLNKALYYANKSLALKNDSTYAYNLLGEIYSKQGNQAAAITAFQKSIFRMPENTTPYINLAKIYESRGDVDFAIEELKTCDSIKGDNDSVKLSLADLLLSSGQYDDAIKYYSSVSDKYKTESVEGIAAAYYALATESVNKSMFRSEKRLVDSLAYINQAIQQNPNNLELYVTKSKLVKLMNSPVESKEVLIKIVSAPNRTIADLLTKGEAYLALGQYRDARNIFAQAVSLDKSLENNLYLAEYFTYNKQYKQASDVLKLVFEKDSANQDGINNVAYIKKMLDKAELNYKHSVYFKKDKDKFFQKVYLDKTLKADPNHIEANLALAKLLKKEKDIYGANRCYKVVLGASDNEKQIKKVAKKSRSLDKKIAKLEAKKVVKQQTKKNNDVYGILPVNYVK